MDFNDIYTPLIRNVCGMSADYTKAGSYAIKKGCMAVCGFTNAGAASNWLFRSDDFQVDSEVQCLARISLRRKYCSNKEILAVRIKSGVASDLPCTLYGFIVILSAAS